jgi:hypothetical protein
LPQFLEGGRSVTLQPRDAQLAFSPANKGCLAQVHLPIMAALHLLQA